MKHKFYVAILVAAFGLTVPSVTFAAPIDNDDGSQTCNASGPSGGASDGVCANDLATNESYCDGGLSSEPGGGTTCSERKVKKPSKSVKATKTN